MESWEPSQHLLIDTGKASEKYRSRCSSLCSLLQSPITSSLLGPNIFLIALFSPTLLPRFFRQCKGPSSLPIQRSTREMQTTALIVPSRLKTIPEMNIPLHIRMYRIHFHFSGRCWQELSLTDTGWISRELNRATAWKRRSLVCYQLSPWDFFVWPQGNLIGGALTHVALDSIMRQLISIHTTTKNIYGTLTGRLPYVCFLGYRFSQLVVRLFPVVVRVLHVGRGEVWGATVGTCDPTQMLKI